MVSIRGNHYFTDPQASIEHTKNIALNMVRLYATVLQKGMASTNDCKMGFVIGNSDLEAFV